MRITHNLFYSKRVRRNRDAMKNKSRAHLNHSRPFIMFSALVLGLLMLLSVEEGGVMGMGGLSLGKSKEYAMLTPWRMRRPITPVVTSRLLLLKTMARSLRSVERTNSIETSGRNWKLPVCVVVLPRLKSRP